MKLNKLLVLAQETCCFKDIIAGLQGKNQVITASLLDAARPYFIAALRDKINMPVLLITSQPQKSKALYAEMVNWLGQDDVYLMPEPSSLAYQHTANDRHGELERLQLLAVLVSSINTVPVIVSSVPALMQLLPSGADFNDCRSILRAGAEVDLFRILADWQEMGYHLESNVGVPGEISHRGGIVDIFPVASEKPVRIELFGNNIESIRFFNPQSQRSVSEIDNICITPASESFNIRGSARDELLQKLDTLDLSSLNYEAKQGFLDEITALHDDGAAAVPEIYRAFYQRHSLLEHIPANTLLVLEEPHRLQLAADNLERELSGLAAEKEARNELPSNFPKPYVSWQQISDRFVAHSSLSLLSWEKERERAEFKPDFKPVPGYAGQLAVLVQKTRDLLRRKKRVIVISRQAKRLAEIFDDANIIASPVTEINELPSPGALTLVEGSIANGWVMADETCLLGDSEIFGFTKQLRAVRHRTLARPEPVTEFHPGDYLVHVDHGIARFLGITRMGGNGKDMEYLVLQYAGGDKLYVPADQINRVSRYLGGGAELPSLTRLGSQEWQRAKQRTSEEVARMAQELLELYASREVLNGISYSPDQVWQQEMEASFPYVETPDQLSAIRQVKEDMQQPKPMDRLVCGDVGYGKTEVAVRAAFKAVLDGRQVAVLVPTTILAEQHFITFSQRMEAFPVKIEVLSRFRSDNEQQKVIDALSLGKVDIVIGTHRLLQKDVSFKNLGLLIIDEEQRFGVSHKEYLKQMRREVDVLTLSATPIPRTLHMSLVGVRDISVMETPPEERLPIRSYVSAYDGQLIREAILRELERNGQAFFVHNRVHDIHYITSKLSELVPEAKFTVAHGQMNEDELALVMKDFTQGKSDVLVCTTIIESGLDMPNVNTLIVNRADRFGLTQLYQLRGRVGRGAETAYAYLLYDRERKLTLTAEKRLQTILEATELGAGFNIAMKDLEIRGAGTLLGTHQSGFISAVGFELYSQMLADAVSEQRANRGKLPAKSPSPGKLPPPQLDLPFAASLPEEYVNDMSTRLELYRRLTLVEDETQLDEMADELKDRFGQMPLEVENLLYSVRIKILAERAAIEKIGNEKGFIVLSLFPGMSFHRDKLSSFLKYGIVIGNNQLRINSRRRLGAEWRGVLTEILRCLSG